MKYLLATAGIAMLFGASTLPASAYICYPETTHGSATSMPPICALPETKEKHPGWFRDGGYCEGGTTTSEVSGNTHCKVPSGP